jgi:hypothetical protein
MAISREAIGVNRPYPRSRTTLVLPERMNHKQYYRYRDARVSHIKAACVDAKNLDTLTRLE